MLGRIPLAASPFGGTFGLVLMYRATVLVALGLAALSRLSAGERPMALAQRGS